MYWDQQSNSTFGTMKTSLIIAPLFLLLVAMVNPIPLQEEDLSEPNYLLEKAVNIIDDTTHQSAIKY